MFDVALSIASIRCLTLRSATRATTGKTRSTRTITKHVRPVLTEALNLQTIATTSLILKEKRERNVFYRIDETQDIDETFPVWKVVCIQLVHVLNDYFGRLMYD